jgi:hypothetical protein
MAICKKCGNEKPVLRSASKPEGQRFVGMCKPCIMAEIRNADQRAQAAFKSILNSLFG